MAYDMAYDEMRNSRTVVQEKTSVREVSSEVYQVTKVRRIEVQETYYENYYKKQHEKQHMVFLS
jgi:hypothetical protein